MEPVLSGVGILKSALILFHASNREEIMMIPVEDSKEMLHGTVCLFQHQLRLLKVKLLYLKILFIIQVDIKLLSYFEMFSVILDIGY